MRIAAVVMSFFAALWWTVGIWASSAAAYLYFVPFLVGGFIIIAAFLQDLPAATPEQGKRIGRVVGVASGLEGLAILAAFIFVPRMQSLDFSVSVQAIIVGLHFILIARGLSVRAYYVAAALLVGIGASGFAIGDPKLHVQYVCFGAACTLWLSYGMAMRLGYQPRFAPARSRGFSRPRSSSKTSSKNGMWTHMR